MRKLTLIIGLLLCSSVMFAQKGKVMSATSFFTQGKLDKAKELIDEAINHEKCVNWGKAYLVRGQIYQAIYEQQKQFIGNASHELQTPLAICQNRLEMLAEQEDTTERQLAEINKIQETLAYIIRLNKSLLFLSKIENGQFRDNRMVCLNDILHRQLEDYQDIYAYKGIRLRLAEEGQLHADMSPTLATALVTNLLKNTYIHNIPDGEIDIRITPRSLTFRNTGIPEALDSDRVFHRFYQGKTPGQNSSGLGLSISQAICHLYHIRIAYRYDGMHCFELLWEKTEK